MLVTQEQLQKQAKGPPKWRSKRFLVSYMGATGLTLMYIQRVSMSLVIVCMVNHTAVHHWGHQGEDHSGQQPGSGNVTTTLRWTDDLSPRPPNTSLDPSTAQQDHRCGDNDTDAVPNSDEDGPFAWEKQTQGLLLAALFLGYTVGQIPVGLIICRFGVRMTTFTGFMVMSLSHALCHAAALLSPWAVFTLRIIAGFCNACVIVPVHAVWGKWAPSAELSRLMGISFSGMIVGSLAVFPFTALLCRYGFLGGWPSVFYVFGGLGVLWGVAWLYLVRDSPEVHPRISPEEQRYIVSTRGDVTQDTVNVTYLDLQFLTSS